MKKFIVRSLIVLFVLLVVAVFAVGFFLDGAIKTGFNTVGPTITKVDTKVDGINLSLLSGAGKMKGLFIGNPEGFKGPFTMRVASSSFAIKPGSLLTDKIVIKSVNIESPELTLETDLKSFNLKKLLFNVQETTGTTGKESPKAPSKDSQPKESQPKESQPKESQPKESQPKESQPKESQPTEPQPTAEPAAKSGKKLQVDEFIITGAKLHISINAPIVGQKSATVPVTDVRLPPLGQGPEGITAGELSGIALKAILEASIKAGEKAIEDILKGGQFMGKELSTNSVETLQKSAKGLGDLFKKKK